MPLAIRTGLSERWRFKATWTNALVIGPGEHHGELDQGGNKVVTDATGTNRTQTERLVPETAFERRIPDWTALSRTRGEGS
jgi:hypothetical protein